MAVLACIGLVLGLTAIYVSTLGRTYQATALVTLEDRPGQQDVPLQAERLEDQLRLIESRAMAERLVDRLDLHFLPEFRPDAAARGFRFGQLLPHALLDRLPTAWADALVSRPPDPPLTDEQRAARLWQGVIAATLQRVRAAAIPPSTIGVTFTAEDRQLAAAGANALAELYLERRGELRQDGPRGDRPRLGQEIERLRASIRETEQAIAAAQAAAPARAAGEQRLLDLTGELAFWRGERAELEARLGQMQAALASGADFEEAALAPVSERLHQLQASASDLRQALADLSQHYGEEDSSILELRAQLAMLEQERRAEAEYVVQGLREELSIIQSREAALAAEIAALEEQDAEGPASDGLAVLQQRLQAQRKALREHVEQAARELVGQPSARPDARVIEPAVVPKRATHPRLTLIWSSATVGALLLGILVALGLDALRGRDRSSSAGARQVG